VRMMNAFHAFIGAEHGQSSSRIGGALYRRTRKGRRNVNGRLPLEMPATVLVADHLERLGVS
jgi:hypothetical protein